MAIHSHLSVPKLIERAISNSEGRLTFNGAFCAETGKRTGRSPKDRFIVKDDITADTVDWNELNQPTSDAVFSKLWGKVEKWLDNLDSYHMQLHAGSDTNLYEPLNVRTQYAWHAVFANNIFVRPETFNPLNKQPWEYLSAPGFACDPSSDGTNSEGTVMINFSQKRVLIAGIGYAGEMKKSAFSLLNFLLPDKDVLPMHSSANVHKSGKNTIFFGLSGTGKTTLSADVNCALIGDDEHGWGPDGIFNLEGGCYAKCINLTQEQEPMIFDAIRFGSILENVVLDEQNVPDYFDVSLTENTRCCYPREFIDNAKPANKTGHPDAIVFLTCDLNGVLPPVSMLDADAASYHFLSGYTAVVGGTEVGKDIQPTFSTCFGAPFFPRPPRVYASLLRQKIAEYNCPVYLVNTGWIGGSYGVGSRIKLSITRQIVESIQNGDLQSVEHERIDRLNLSIPTRIDNVDSKILQPRNNWNSADEYDRQLDVLTKQFQANFAKFDVEDSIKNAGPR